MRARSFAALLALLAVPRVAVAQHGGAAPARPPVHTVPGEATQFDFLVGQWELVVRPQAMGLAQRIHGAPRLAGTWKAWRALDGWGIEDELRIVDGSGNPVSLAHAVRVFDADGRHWSQTTLDVYRARFTSATGEWRDGQMQLVSQGTDADGRAYVQRTRYYDITAKSFRFQQDRSYDDGRTWDEAVLRIEARR